MKPILQVAMNKYNITFVCTVVVGLVCIGEVAVVIAQSDSANSERRDIIVKWLDRNDTSNALPVSISHEEFWAVFNSFLTQSINESTEWNRSNISGSIQ
jgi:hypothetical protein